MRGIKKRYYLSLAILPIFLLFSCEKNPGIENNISQISIQGNVPGEGLSADDGTFTIEVESSYNRWKVVAGDVVQGEGFISDFSPGFGGDPETGTTTTEVLVSYNKNNNYVVNIQQLIVKSITDDTADTLIVTQKPQSVIVENPITVTLNPSVTYQTISGFGGANTIWGTDFLSAEELRLALGTDDDCLGLSILRVRLSSDKSEWGSLLTNLKEAKKYNIKILATPWSPPGELTSNDSNIGGYLLAENYGTYAAYLNEFVEYMASNDVPIDVVSVQNEPDWETTYESCDWSPANIFNFVKNNASVIQGAKVLAAESLNFNHSYTDDILNDPVAVNNIDIVAGHLYGTGGLKSYPLAEQKGKEIWMTEYLLNLNSGNYPDNWTENTSPEVIWDETMTMLGGIQTSMLYNWNAYIWWYIRRFYSFLGDGERGTSRETVLKRGYAMSQFSMFVRPGYERIETQIDDTSTGMLVTAYKGDDKQVVVIINQDDVIHGTSLRAGESFSSAMVYTTNVNKNRQKIQMTPDEGVVLLNIEAKSITTIVFQ